MRVTVQKKMKAKKWPSLTSEMNKIVWIVLCRFDAKIEKRLLIFSLWRLCNSVRLKILLKYTHQTIFWLKVIAQDIRSFCGDLSIFFIHWKCVSSQRSVVASRRQANTLSESRRRDQRFCQMFTARKMGRHFSRLTSYFFSKRPFPRELNYYVRIAWNLLWERLN